MTGGLLEGSFDAVVRTATPLGLAALGELIAERSGVINIGIEGSMCFAAFAAFVTGVALGPEAGLAVGAAAGAAIAAIFALFVTRFGAQQIIAGTAISMLGLGLSATLNHAFGPERAGSVTTLGTIAIPGLSELPLVGSALFAQSVTTYMLYALVPIAYIGLYRTTWGLALRATGENPAAVVSVGNNPARIRFFAIVASGVLAGLAGATLVVAQAGTFSDGMSAGRGFVAIAIVAMGRWTPVGVVLGTLLFGAVGSAQFVVQSYGGRLPYTLALAAPYALTIVALAVFRGSRAAPAALGTALEERSED